MEFSRVEIYKVSISGISSPELGMHTGIGRSLNPWTGGFSSPGSELTPDTRVLPCGHRSQMTLSRTQFFLPIGGVWGSNLVFRLVGQQLDLPEPSHQPQGYY